MTHFERFTPKYDRPASPQTEANVSVRARELLELAGVPLGKAGERLPPQTLALLLLDRLTTELTNPRERRLPFLTLCRTFIHVDSFSLSTTALLTHAVNTDWPRWACEAIPASIIPLSGEYSQRGSVSLVRDYLTFLVPDRVAPEESTGGAYYRLIQMDDTAPLLRLGAQFDRAIARIPYASDQAYFNTVLTELDVCRPFVAEEGPREALEALAVAYERRLGQDTDLFSE